MARHRPTTPADTAAKADVAAALGAAHAELERRKAYEQLKRLERRITEYSPVPGDPPYVESFSDLAKS